jgi:glutamate 5-kinase
MIDPVRQEIVGLAATVVVKVGTNVLTRENGSLEPDRVEALTAQIQRLRASGRKVALVSSGAVGAGVGRLGLGRRPTDLRELQACAAVGQAFLMRAYEDSLRQHNVPTAQVLLTAADFDSRGRYLNVRNTLVTLFEWGCLPIINENDTVSVAEIRFGDNDHLAALVTNLLQAPLLVLLTNVDGLHAADPAVDASAPLLSTVPAIDAAILGKAGSGRSALGSGGMTSKLRAARLATVAGGAVIMANGARKNVLDEIFAAEPVGTLFLAQSGTLPAWKRWLGYAVRPKGRLIVDRGARQAVERDGRSLLPIGLVQVVGSFGKGDVVALCDPDGVEFARGLTNYASTAADRVLGLRSEQIRDVLGGCPYEEIVHRDNLVVIR